MARIERIGASEAARRKNCSRQALNYAIRSKKIDAERIGNQNVVLVNRKFEDWAPNPKVQKAGKARAKKAKKAKRK